MKLTPSNMESPSDYTKNWKGEQIIINSNEQFEQLLKEGFELLDIVIQGDGSGVNISLRMESDSKQIIANGNEIHDYLSHLKSLYDPLKKKNCFVWIPDTEVYWDFEKKAMLILEGEYTEPIQKKIINSKNKKKIHDHFIEWIKSEEKYTSSLEDLSIFFKCCFIKEYDEKIDFQILSKKKLSLNEIKKIETESESCENVFILSFFLFSKQISKMDDLKDDVIVGAIIYDVKAKQTLSINFKSVISFYKNPDERKGDGFFKIVKHLFQKSIDSDFNYTSYLPFPINSRWYTPLPWIQYSVLNSINLDEDMSNDKQAITIPQFFTFGCPTDPRNGSNFSYQVFSEKGNGRAVCILYFNNENENIPYNLRFDQSEGEPLVHLDFAFRSEKGETKLITHDPLNLEDVYNFHPDLFLSITMAGLFDSYFTTIMQEGIKGMKELANRNPAFLYILKIILTVEIGINWLNQNTDGYPILSKLFEEEKLSASEKQFVDKMLQDKVDFIVPPTETKPVGINLYGFMINQRYKRGMTTVTLLS